MVYGLILAGIVSFLTTLIITPRFKDFFESAGISGTDVQKVDRPRIAEMGGPAVIAGFLAGVFLFIWTEVFIYGTTTELIKIFAAISTILIITLIGVFDDLGCLLRIRGGNIGFKKYKRIGLKQWQKPLLTLPAAIPLMAIMAGNSSLTIPLFGRIDVGIAYPLILLPIAIMGASSATNMLAGINGLEAGLGLVTLTALGLYAYSWNQIGAAIIAFTLAAALLAFLRYNWYPAKIFPGDSLTYAIGAGIACVAIIGNIEKFALIIFTPWFIEFLLKARSWFKAESFGVLQKDSTLKAPYDTVYSLNHLVMKFGRFKEWQISLILIILEILICIFAFIIVSPLR